MKSLVTILDYQVVCSSTYGCTLVTYRIGKQKAKQVVPFLVSNRKTENKTSFAFVVLK